MACDSHCYIQYIDLLMPYLACLHANIMIRPNQIDIKKKELRKIGYVLLVPIVLYCSRSESKCFFQNSKITDAVQTRLSTKLKYMQTKFVDKLKYNIK